MPTTNLKLPLFDASTPPDLITVVNAAFQTLDTTIKSIQDAAGTLNGTVTSLNETVQSLNSTVQGHTTKISTIEGEIRDLQGKGVNTTPTSVLTTEGLKGVGVTADGILVNRQPD